MIDLSRVPPELFAPSLEGNLRRLGPAAKLHNHFLDAVRLRLMADCAGFVHGPRGGGGTLVRGERERWDAELLAAFLRRERPAVPDNALIVPLTSSGRLLGLAAAFREAPFTKGERRILTRLGEVLVAEVHRREEERLDRVFNRIRQKIVAELRPRDLAYQILDGLHQLVDYDHSSAFLAYDPAASVLRLEAEKIVWTKAKSAYVGREMPVSCEEVAQLRGAAVVRQYAQPAPSSPPAGAEGGDVFRRVLDAFRESSSPQATGLLSAPLYFGGQFLGLLKIAARDRPSFDSRDLEVVRRFLPAAAVAMRNAQVNLSLEKQAVEAEVKASLVTLARAVAHDVNNAVGGILPLAQQMREDLLQGRFVPQTFERDLEVILDNARLCQRIFTNMLRAGTGGGVGRRDDGPVDLAATVREALSFFLAKAERRGVRLELDLPDGLPPVRASRDDLQHVVLNLVHNSLDALPEQGGHLRLAAALSGDTITLEVSDDGAGIAPELLDKVQEPFFTTKTGGTGLGLAICRALVWQNGGSLSIDSAPGTGTRVSIHLSVDRPGRKHA